MNSQFNFLNIGGFSSVSIKLQETLKNPNTTLEEILDEDMLVPDFKDDKAHITN